jgi:hypothetical protein
MIQGSNLRRLHIRSILNLKVQIKDVKFKSNFEFEIAQGYLGFKEHSC